MLNNTLLVNMIVMKTDTGADDTSKGTESLLAGADGTLKGTEKGPESKNTSATALECTVALANTNGSVTPDPLDLVFSFKKDLHSATEKLKWDMSISNALLIVKGAIVKEFPAEAADIEDAYNFVENPIAWVESLAAKEGFNLAIAEDFTSKERKYLAVDGSEQDGGFGLTLMGEKAYNGSHPCTGMLFSLSMTSDGLSELFKKIFNSATDPLASVPVFSNVNVAALVATRDMQLPTAISLPSPYSSITNVKKGLWLEGQLRKPTGCANSPVCALLDKALVGNESYLSLQAGITDTDISLEIGLEDVKLSNKVTLSCDLEFKAELVDPSVEIKASASLAVDLKNSMLTFTGALDGELSAKGPSIGLTFAMSGMYANAFTLQNFNLYDLVLGGAISGIGLESFEIGGGLCIGKQTACATLTDNPAPELLYQRLLPSDRLELFQDDSISVTPHSKMAHEIFGSDQRAWPAYMRNELDMDVDMDMNTLQVHSNPSNLTIAQGVQAGGAIAAKAYIGMDIAHGGAFLYAAISQVSLMDLAKAFTDSDNSLPSWFGEIRIQPYDRAKCAANQGGPACFAYMSVATEEKTISTLNLTIPQGVAAQGTLDLFGAELKFKIAITSSPKAFVIDLEGPPLNMWNELVIAKSADDLTSGPELNANADLSSGQFSLSFEAYAKLGPLGSGSVQVDITNEQAEIDIQIEDIFSIGLGAQTKVIMNLDNPAESSLSTDITLSPEIQQLLKKICDDLVDPILDVVQDLTNVLAKLTTSAQSVITDFNDADYTLELAQDSINNKQNAVYYKEQEGWSWGYYTDLAALKAEVYVEQQLVNIAFDAVNDLKYGFEQVKDTLQEAKAKVAEGGKSAINAVEKIASFTLKEVGFSASGVTEIVELFAIVGFEGGDTTKHSFQFDFSDGIKGIAEQLKEEFLKGIENAATDMLDRIKDSVSGSVLEMELMEVLQDDHRAELVQLGFLKKQITAEGETEYVHPNPEWRDARHEAVVKNILKRKQGRTVPKADL